MTASAQLTQPILLAERHCTVQHHIRAVMLKINVVGQLTEVITRHFLSLLLSSIARDGYMD